MMLAALVALSLSAADADTGKLAPESRERARAWFEVGLGGGVTSFWPVLSAGPSASAATGVVLADRFVLGVRASFMSIVVTSQLAAGPTLAFAVTDWWSVGLGASFQLHLGASQPSLTLTVPVRTSFSFASRPVGRARRSGIVVALEAGPTFGLSVQAGPGGPGFAPPTTKLGISAMAMVGYAFW